jgi:hypothetical protein
MFHWIGFRGFLLGKPKKFDGKTPLVFGFEMFPSTIPMIVDGDLTPHILSCFHSRLPPFWSVKSRPNQLVYPGI